MGWWDTSLRKFYEYGTTGFYAFLPDVKTYVEVTWKKATEHLGMVAPVKSAWPRKIPFLHKLSAELPYGKKP